jgi:hypothetical protein
MEQRRPSHVRPTGLVTRVVLRDVWSGMSPHSPIAAIYELHRAVTGALTGEGKFSTGLVASKTVRVSMKAAATTTFLDALARVRMTPGNYEPFMGHTDDFPSIEIVLKPARNGDPPARNGYPPTARARRGRAPTRATRRRGT